MSISQKEFENHGDYAFLKLKMVFKVIIGYNKGEDTQF